MAILNNSNAISTAGGYDINNSLRFRASASAYLSRTFGTPTTTNVWTWSCWVKRGTLGATQTLMDAGDGVGTTQYLYFNSSDQLYWNASDTAGNNIQNLYTTAVFRDPSAWYHIVAVFNTPSATSTSRAQLYVNGVLQTVTYSLGPVAQNATSNWNKSGSLGRMGKLSYANVYYLDGYMAELNFVDGQALTPSSFGETSTTTGSWVPKAYTGTYGNNGFYLKFSDIATTSGSNAGLGKDFSGNTNYWTTNNISVTAGTTYDAMIDSPTLTSATVANYCVLNPIQNLYSYTTFSNANLTVSNSNNTSEVSRGTFSVSSGKWYFEATVGTATGVMIGITGETVSGTALSALQYLYGYTSANSWSNGAFVTYGASFTTGDIIGVALDMDAGTLTFYKNNTSQGSFVTGLTGAYQPAFSRCTAAPSASFNFGQRPFTYTPPSGYKALNTFNLPSSTIPQGNLYMDATLYTGTGSAATITNTAGFKPDFVWLKSRSNTYNNGLFNSISGVNKVLVSNSTDQEQTETAGSLNAFNSNGFGLGGGSANYAGVNINGATYVGWQWQAGQGSTSSNTSGSITSTVSVNATAGFSIVTYTGNATNPSTVGHGLGVAPKMIITKQRNAGTYAWNSYHASLGNTQYVALSTTDAASSGVSLWNNTSPTSTVFTINHAAVNSATTYVAYCWAEIAGFSKFGSYTGNGSADGPFVYTGFRPKWILVKQSSSAGNAWQLLDSSRNTYNKADNALFPNTSGAETTGNATFDFLSNGFKVRTTDGTVNTSSSTYIYMAFAENPFKNSNAR